MEAFKKTINDKLKPLGGDVVGQVLVVVSIIVIDTTMGWQDDATNVLFLFFSLDQGRPTVG